MGAFVDAVSRIIGLSAGSWDTKGHPCAAAYLSIILLMLGLVLLLEAFAQSHTGVFGQI